MAESPLSPSFNAMDLHSNSTTDSTLRQSANSSSADSSTQSVGAGANDGGGAVNLQFPAPPVTAHIQIKLPLLSSSSSNSEGEGEGDGSGEAAAADANAEGNGEPGGRAASPPPNCAICLGRCKNKCYTDSCRHQFCFKCLCEWSKVKPECPLCKQSFKSIIHNVKSEDQYEQYHIQQPTVQIPHRPFEMSMRLPRMFGEDFTLPNWDSPNIMSRVGRSFFYRGDGPANYRHNVELEAVNQALDNNRRVGNQNMFRGELLELYRQEFPEAIVSSAALSSLWRRYVYDRNLYALPVCDITGHFREVSARFYRDNPAQIHRLMPWINRDVLCLLRNNQTEDVSTVMTLIRDNLPIMNILSPAFRRCIAPWLGQKTAHFIHELYNFARSPYDMVGYDRAVHYSAVNEETIEFSSASSNEDNAAGTSRSNAAASSTATTNAANVATGLAMIGIADTTVVTATSTITSQSPSSSTSRRHRHRRHHNAGGSGAGGNALDNRLFDHGTSSTAVAETTTSSVGGGGQSVTFSIDTTPEGLEVPGISVSSSSTSGGGSRVGSQAQAINLSTHNRTGPLVIDSDDEVFQAANLLRNNSMWNREPPTREARQSARLAAHWNVTANIELSTSSSDECEFVMERRAPHLRTPEEMVSLNSDSDSDVVFVTEIKSNLKKSSFKTSDEEDDNEDGDEQEQEQQRQRDNVPSTSTRRPAPRPRLENIEEYMDRVGPSTSSGVRSSARNTARTERQLRDRRLLRSSGAGGGEYNFGDTSSSNNGSGSEYECSTRSSKAAKQAKRNKRKSSRKSRSGTRSSRRSGGGGKHSKRSHANMEEGNEGSSNERRSKRKRRKVNKPANDHHTDDETDEGAEDGIRLDVLQARLKGGSGPNDERSNITKSYLEQAAQNVPNIPSETESGDSSESASESDSDSAIQKARELHRRLRGYNGSPMKVKDELVEEDSQDANSADDDEDDDDDGGTVVPDGKHIVGDEEEDNRAEEENANSGDSEEESSEDDDEDNDNVRDAANGPAAIDMNAHSEQSNSDSQNSHAEEEIQVEAADTTEQNDHQSDNEEHPAADDGEEQQWTDCSSDSDTSNERRKTPTELRKIPKIIIKEIKRSDSAQSFTSSSASSHSTATTVTSKANSRASPTNECASPVTELAGEVSRTSPTPSNAASVSDSASSSSSSTGSSNSNSNSNSDTSSYTSGSATSSRNPSPNTTALENNEQQQNQFHVEAEEGGDHSFDVSQDAGDVIVDGIVDAPITDDNQNEDDSMSTSGNEPYDAAHPQDDNTNNAAIDIPTSFSEVGEGSASGWSDMNL